MTPTSLAKLYFDQTGLSHWRVRNTTTLEDFVILWPKSFSGSLPDWFVALALDAALQKAQLRGDTAVFVLLSTPEEAKYLSRLKESELHRTLRESYSNVPHRKSVHLATKKHEFVEDPGLWAYGGDPSCP